MRLHHFRNLKMSYGKLMNRSKTLIAPSLLAADFTRLAEEIRAVEAAGADWLHLDIMDGHFVPNISFGPSIIKQIRPLTKLPFDVHLMIAPVDPLLPEFIAAGADWITVHPESGSHLHRTLSMIRDAGKHPGVVLNPSTPVSALDHVMDIVDQILIMTVNPGFGGQKFLPLFEKITAVKQKIKSSGRDIRLAIDGGVSFDNAPQLRAAGADVLIAGTNIFGKGPENYAKTITQLRG
jgi:ribulose-phosphate 3-epimerase